MHSRHTSIEREVEPAGVGRIITLAVMIASVGLAAYAFWSILAALLPVLGWLVLGVIATFVAIVCYAMLADTSRPLRQHH